VRIIVIEVLFPFIRPAGGNRCGLWRLSAISLAIGLLNTACTKVPPLSHATNNFPGPGNVSTQDIVQRVKCELAEAFDDKIVDPRSPKQSADPKFQWLQNWTAAIDLTLSINEQGGITPSASYLLPLKNAYNAAVGPSTLGGTTIPATAQSFNLGIGATYNGQAVRTELLTFALSLKELKEWHSYQKCDRIPDGFDLEGRVDLKSWVDEALRPVVSDQLQSGNHVAPQTQKPAGAGNAVPGGRVYATPADGLVDTINSVRAQIASPACIAAAGNNAADKQLCTEASTQLNLLKATCDTSAHRKKTDGERAAAKATCGQAAQAGDVEKLSEVCLTVAKKDEVAEKACKQAKDGFPPLDPETDPTFYASGIANAVGQAVAAAKQAGDARSQAEASETEAARSVSDARQALNRLSKETTDGVFYKKVAGAGDNAQTAAENARNWARSARRTAECVNTAAGQTKTDAKNYDENEESKQKAFEKESILYSYYGATCATLTAIVAKNAAAQARSAAAFAAAAAAAPNAPIESLSQSLEFVVTTGINASPSWILLFWKGPSTSGNLLSLSGIRTHTLDIALGPPGAGGAKTGPQQQNAINALGTSKLKTAIESLGTPF
jgi:hypothetical protein